MLAMRSCRWPEVLLSSVNLHACLAGPSQGIRVAAFTHTLFVQDGHLLGRSPASLAYHDDVCQRRYPTSCLTCAATQLPTCLPSANRPCVFSIRCQLYQDMLLFMRPQSGQLPSGRAQSEANVRP